MLCASAETPLSYMCNVPYVQFVPTATIAVGNSWFMVQEEKCMDSLHGITPVHALSVHPQPPSYHQPLPETASHLLSPICSTLEA